MVKKGEVYWDGTLNCEVTILDVGDEVLIIDDSAGGEGEREYRRWQWEHNHNVGRYKKIREEDVEYENEQDEEESTGIFDF